MVVEGAGVRENSVLHARQEDDGELQALAGVERHERDRPGALVEVVLLAAESRLVEEGDGRWLLYPLLELLDGAHELPDVLQARGGLGA